MSSRKSRVARMLSRSIGIGLLVFVVSMAFVAPALAADVNPGWGKWWLPPDRSSHGHAADTLFLWIFWLTMVIFVVTEVVLVVFLLKYRDKPGAKKAYFTHGNPKLEMAWTIAPAVILAALALGSKKAWDAYRYSPDNTNPNRATVLVIGEQFAWNFIYPGPDGKLGRYLLFPRPSDAKWPVGPDGQPTMFEDKPGPASLPYKEAIAAINRYVGSVNKLGKDWSDPDGKDDNIEASMNPSRALVLPANRPVEVQLSSKDVIHSFFLPNHRVKLDAVPGMRGKVVFTGTMTSAARSQASVRNISIDEFEKLMLSPQGRGTVLVIDESAPGTETNKNRDANGWRYVNAAGGTIARSRQPLPADAAVLTTRIGMLKTAGLTEVKIADAGNWELNCAELCGANHNTMIAAVTFLSNEEYDRLNYDKPYTPPTSAAPSTTPAAQ